MGGPDPFGAVLLRLDRQPWAPIPQHLYPLPEPTPGEHFTTALGGQRVGEIVAVLPGEQLTARIMGAVMSYVLVRQDR